MLRDAGIEPSFTDESHGVITTPFVEAAYQRIFQMSYRPTLFFKGRFTLKIYMEEITPAYTQLRITLQIRQKKLLGKKERLVKTRGAFETFLAYEINRHSLEVQFPEVATIRLGMSLIPDLKEERYRVAGVETESPAGEAGFRDGDRVLRINGREISIRGELFEELLPKDPARLTEFTIRRGNREARLSVRLVRVPQESFETGLRMERVAKERALKVTQVRPGSPAEKAGLRKGDLLRTVNGVPLESWADYYRALRETSGRVADLELWRSGELVRLQLKFGAGDV